LGEAIFLATFFLIGDLEILEELLAGSFFDIFILM
jgi:hypothetical protein